MSVAQHGLVGGLKEIHRPVVVFVRNMSGAESGGHNLINN